MSASNLPYHNPYAPLAQGHGVPKMASRTEQFRRGRIEAAARVTEPKFPVWHPKTGKMEMHTIANKNDLLRFHGWLDSDPNETETPVEDVVVAAMASNTALPPRVNPKLMELRSALALLGVKAEPTWGIRELSARLQARRAELAPVAEMGDPGEVEAAPGGGSDPVDAETAAEIAATEAAVVGEDIPAADAPADGVPQADGAKALAKKFNAKPRAVPNRSPETPWGESGLKQLTEQRKAEAVDKS